MARGTSGTALAVIVASALAIGCGGGDPPIDEIDAGTLTDGDAGRDASFGDEDADLDAGPSLPPGRYVRRLTADQLAASLLVVTGQPWPSYESRAATLGRPDLYQTLVEGEQLSPAFLRFADEGARVSCGSAIDLEVTLTRAEQRPILGALDMAAPDVALRRANLRRLMLRFHGFDITDDADARLAPFLAILESDLPGSPPPAELEASRWETVCVALATHLDFLTY